MTVYERKNVFGFNMSSSKPMLSKNSQSPQGSQTMETGRTWIQHDLQTKYKLSAFFSDGHCLFLAGSEYLKKGRKEKLFVARNDHLKRKT